MVHTDRIPFCPHPLPSSPHTAGVCSRPFPLSSPSTSPQDSLRSMPPIPHFTYPPPPTHPPACRRRHGYLTAPPAPPSPPTPPVRPIEDRHAQKQPRLRRRRIQPHRGAQRRCRRRRPADVRERAAEVQRQVRVAGVHPPRAPPPRARGPPARAASPRRWPPPWTRGPRRARRAPPRRRPTPRRDGGTLWPAAPARCVRVCARGGMDGRLAGSRAAAGESAEGG
jgi:hypothetical protein